MSSNGNFGVELRVDIRTYERPNGILGSISFDGFLLHTREETFVMDKESGYTKHPRDKEVFEHLAESLLNSTLISGKREIFNIGARDEIVSFALLDKPISLEEHRSEITLVVVLTLVGCGFKVNLTEAKA